MPREETNENATAVAPLTREAYERVAKFLNEVHAPVIKKSTGARVIEFKVKWSVMPLSKDFNLWARAIAPSIFISRKELSAFFKVFSSKAIKAGFDASIIAKFNANFEYHGEVTSFKMDESFIRILDQLAQQYEHQKKRHIGLVSAGLFAPKGVPAAVSIQVMGTFLTYENSIQMAFANKAAVAASVAVNAAGLAINAAGVAANAIEDNQVPVQSQMSLT